MMLIEHGCVTDAALSELEADDYAPRRDVPQSVVSPLRDDLVFVFLSILLLTCAIFPHKRRIQQDFVIRQFHLIFGTAE
jgi:hypothetical protein